MHRFYLPPEFCTGPMLALDARESHHAVNVLRVRKGEHVAVMDGAGHEFLCSVHEVHRKAVLVGIEETRSFAAPPFSITLVQAIPKGKLMESIIQKATELGATRVQPLLSERVAAHLDKDGAEHKADKWSQTAVEAIKQCGQPWLPSVQIPRSLAQCLSAMEKPELALVGALQGDARNPREYFSQFRARHQRNPRSVALWIGPEGDFSSCEMEIICASNALPITLGPLVLRCETAALYALSVISYELREQAS
jgi:16S rRNA (uracil1498-N3)-methyltransferase